MAAGWAVTSLSVWPRAWVLLCLGARGNGSSQVSLCRFINDLGASAWGKWAWKQMGWSMSSSMWTPAAEPPLALSSFLTWSVSCQCTTTVPQSSAQQSLGPLHLTFALWITSIVRDFCGHQLKCRVGTLLVEGGLLDFSLLWLLYYVTKCGVSEYQEKADF